MDTQTRKIAGLNGGGEIASHAFGNCSKSSVWDATLEAFIQAMFAFRINTMGRFHDGRFV
jgi:hypothetical protein